MAEVLRGFGIRRLLAFYKFLIFGKKCFLQLLTACILSFKIFFIKTHNLTPSTPKAICAKTRNPLLTLVHSVFATTAVF